MDSDIPKKSEQKLNRDNLNNLPSHPGVYFFFDSDGQLLYIGKAINLKRRVKSYFQNSKVLDSKTKTLVSHIKSFAITRCLNDLAAILLESYLISTYQPRYNVLSREKRKPVYIAITQEKIPRVYLTHRKPPSTKLYGPYYSTKNARYILKTLRPIIKYRSCQRLPVSPCLYFELNLCQAPCQNKTNLTAYQTSIKQLDSLLSGKYSQLLKRLKKEMNQLAKIKKFEAAAKLRDTIDLLTLSSRLYGSTLNQFESSLLAPQHQTTYLTDLQKMLHSHFSQLALSLNSRIEGYDISHLSATDITGSMVVFKGSMADKSNYRRFRINPTEGLNDDSVRLHSILLRRLQHSDWSLPQLILIDGGKPQVSLALKALAKHNLTIPIIGLAKKRETIVIKKDKFQYLHFSKSRPGMILLRQIRDESHRFAKNYHLKLRNQAIKL